MKKMLEEFKKFIARGNIVDLAIAVVIGTAFSAIVSSLVNDIIMPLVGMIIGNNFTNLSFTVNNSVVPYGNFIQAIVNFLIIALCVFVISKVINKLMKKEEEKKEEKPKKSDEVKLLEEIRDLMKNKK